MPNNMYLLRERRLNIFIPCNENNILRDKKKNKYMLEINLLKNYSLKYLDPLTNDFD